jgi:hypothetical protein
MDRMITLTRILMVMAAVTLVVASAIHSGLLGALDPFEAAALPEAIIGGVLIVGLAVLLRSPTLWRFTLGATLFAALGAVEGLRVTLPRAEPGDIAYHLSLLGVLVALTALLVRGRERSA